VIEMENQGYDIAKWVSCGEVLHLWFKGTHPNCLAMHLQNIVTYIKIKISSQ
jgi:hypothetical protein